MDNIEIEISIREGGKLTKCFEVKIRPEYLKRGGLNYKKDFINSLGRRIAGQLYFELVPEKEMSEDERIYRQI